MVHTREELCTRELVQTSIIDEAKGAVKKIQKQPSYYYDDYYCPYSY